MQEKIYTIPVNEAFEQSGDECPFCFLYKKLEKIEHDGAGYKNNDQQKRLLRQSL